MVIPLTCKKLRSPKVLEVHVYSSEYSMNILCNFCNFRKYIFVHNSMENVLFEGTIRLQLYFKAFKGVGLLLKTRLIFFIFVQNVMLLSWIITCVYPSEALTSEY